MSRTNIYQIYYDQDSKSRLDPGFIALDNSDNPRPDWREYWPIRQFLLNNTLNEDELYGFLSPLFYGKTMLDAGTVQQFIDTHPGYDVYGFSPFLQDSACYLNIIEHGNSYHPGMWQLTDALLRSIGAEIDFQHLVMDLNTTIFCNYFVAKPAFWAKWFALTEHLFEITEDSNNALGREINSMTSYKQATLNMKVFIIERIASLILSQDNSVRIASYDIEQMPWSDPAYRPYQNQMMRLNALKLAYRDSGEPRHLDDFFAQRIAILNACRFAQAVSPQQRHFFWQHELQSSATSAISPAPAQPQYHASASASAMLHSAVININAAHYEEAFTQLNLALAEEPENAEVVFQMGRLAATCNMHDDAKQLFHQAILRKPELVNALIDFYRGQVQDARAGKI